MIKREFTNTDIQKLASRVNLAEWTVREERIMQILYDKQEKFNTFADESSAARQDMELDNNTINQVMEDEIRRIREKYTEDQIKMLTG